MPDVHLQYRYMHMYRFFSQLFSIIEHFSGFSLPWLIYTEHQGLFFTLKLSCVSVFCQHGYAKKYSLEQCADLIPPSLTSVLVVFHLCSWKSHYLNIYRGAAQKKNPPQSSFFKMSVMFIIKEIWTAMFNVHLAILFFSFRKINEI